MLDRCIATVEAMASAQEPVKVVAYLSAEFLTGPHLGNSLITTAAYLVQPRSIVLLSRLLATPSDAGEKPWKLRSRTTRSPSIPSPNANWS
jgi:starch phosphorylase